MSKFIQAKVLGKDEGKPAVVNVGQITFIEQPGNYVKVHFAGGESISLITDLQSLYKAIREVEGA